MHLHGQDAVYIQHEFCSHGNSYGPICEGYTTMFDHKLNRNEVQFQVPAELGYGCNRRIKVNDSIDICLNDMQLFHDTQLSGRTQGDACVMLFCLGEHTIWEEMISGQTIELQNGSGVLSRLGEVNEVCVYQSNRHYQGLTVSFHPKRIAEYFSSAGFGERIFTRRHMNYELVDYILPAEARIIIAEVLHCPYQGAIRALYLEGKVLELLAVCVDAAIERSSERNDPIKLSRIDVESIKRAKEILDNSIASPVSIANLSRMVCLNESKLKSGFKHIYGSPVYTYLLGKRMETARILLETRDISVTQVADYVGYGSASSFSKAFHKKYGFYPSECVDTTKFRKNGSNKKNSLLEI